MKFAWWVFLGLAAAAGGAHAQNNISALSVNSQDDGKVLVRVELDQPLDVSPPGFTTEAPPRIVFDFIDTTQSLGKRSQEFGTAGLRSADVVQAGGRTRLVLNLDRMRPHSASIEGNTLVIALQGEAAAAPAVAAAPAPEPEPVELRFDISRYVLDGATLLTEAEISAAVAPFTGKNKDFSDVQRALEAVEDAYAKRGYSAIRVALPEQELEKGTVRFRVVESRFDKVTVKDNKHVSEANALNAVPSVRSGGMPVSRQIARELKLANENPARQMNVVLKPGEEDGQVDASIIVTDSEPVSWGLTADNSGTPETGRSRFGLSWQHANIFDADHVASLQFQISPEHIDRVTVLGGGYKVPLYELGDSLEFFGGYSNVNSVVGGLVGGPSNFQGGGLILSARYNHPLEKTGAFDRKLSFGLDWRNFRRIEQTNPPVTVLYNEITVMPLSLAYSAQGRFAKSDLSLNAALSANLPGMDKGKTADFAAYDQVNLTRPESNYRVLRYGASYSTLLGDEWQLRAAVNGQWSGQTLIQGEQMRLGGADAVRGFAEGSVSGEKGVRWNLEGYTPDFGSGDVNARGLVFFDGGETRSATGARSSISGAGIGLRAGFAQQFSLRLDMARIINADIDPLQQAGDWRAHVSLSASF